MWGVPLHLSWLAVGADCLAAESTCMQPDADADQMQQLGLSCCRTIPQVSPLPRGGGGGAVLWTHCLQQCAILTSFCSWQGVAITG